MKDISLLESIIVGRVDPHIYAFTTNTIPNYLKVGDTYRPVAVRLQEWRDHFPNLEKQYDRVAKVADDTYFRDYAVHSYLESEMNRTRLQPTEVPAGAYYSREFFKAATAEDVENAFEAIGDDYENRSGKYQFYNAASHLPETFTYARTETYEPRPNQDNTIRAFKAAVDAGRKNLLMYAVMRFGKSFTSMCCAVEMNANVVVVVSAKVDVCEEWKKTVQSHVKFSDYEFLTSKSLIENESAVRDTLSGGKKVVVFLTLQDLQGELIKAKHKEVFENHIDLLIVDETHFGARAEKYGAVLKDVKEKISDEEKLTLENFVENTKYLDAKIRLHLSGTPYRILMGSEFTKDDIIAFYQFTDIVKDQEAWIAENNSKDEPKEEWENPYYGFPQMVRFAFNLNTSARQRLKELRDSGKSDAFSELFMPRSVKKAEDDSHKRFVYEREIYELLEVIDGSKEDSELLGFLDYDKIKDGSMCRHIVFVLPYCASCDALEALIRNNQESFRNLSDYEIINISGVDRTNRYKKPSDIKAAIRRFESEGKKTITLTVNRMLTGSTVEEWDTMLFLKDTASPQEYDQAIFRLQNQYIKKYEDGNGNIIKYNMKPQTLLVDFAPERLFVMQEQKAHIYNVNVDDAGNAKLQDRITDELRISPIVVMNAEKLEQVQAADILEAVSNYSRSRGVAEETAEIPVDLALKDIAAIWDIIGKENELGSKAGFTTKAHEGEGEGTDLDDPNNPATEEEPVADPGTGTQTGTDTDADNHQEEKKNDPVKQFRSYYARILFFAFLTEENVMSLESIIDVMDSGENVRIARNIGIHKSVLEHMLAHMNKHALRELDYSIQRMSHLSHDEDLPPIQRAAVAVQKFGKLGESEVITPAHICEDMVGLIPDDCLLAVATNGRKLLDISSKVGEFAIALCKRFDELGISIDEIKDVIYSIPTSTVTYEFTRKVYSVLGLNIENVAERFTSYDLLNVTTDDGTVDYEKISALLAQNKGFNTITLSDELPNGEGDEKVIFDAVVGNPPYQAMDGGAQKSAGPIYNFFVNVAKGVNPEHITMIIPTRWYAGGKGKELDEFRAEMLNDSHIRELHDFLHPEELFPETNNRGGICYFARSREYDNRENLVKVVSHLGGNNIYGCNRSLKTQDLDIFLRNSQAIEILNKVLQVSPDNISEYVSAAKAFGFRTFFITDPKYRNSADGLGNPILCYGRGNKEGYVERAEITSHTDWIDLWKVYVPESNNIGTELNDDNQNSFVGAPGTICTETFLVVGAELNLDESSASNLAVYLKTRFARFLHSLAKVSQHGTAKTYRFVPLQDFSRAWTDADLYAKYHLTEEEIAFIEAMIKPME